MSRVWFSGELETVVTYWRVLRRDGVTIGLTSHDRDLWFDGVLHAASPGMLPSAIRRSGGFDPDSAEVEGALSHDSITAADLETGRFDGAAIRIGVVDWETLETAELYAGTLGAVSDEDGRFAAELVSRKSVLHEDRVPRTSPTCRAAFCGPGCTLDGQRYTHEAVVASFDPGSNAVVFSSGPEPALAVGGWLRWLAGPQADERIDLVGVTPAGGLILAVPLDEAIATGTRALVREGCDRRFDTCAGRFGNAVNFRGEPFLPGNDLLVRYPAPAA